MDEDQLRKLESRLGYLRGLFERKDAVIRSISEQGKLTPELEAQIHAATTLQEVEDLYLPYRPKRRTRASIAREKGLEPLAQLILQQPLGRRTLEELAQPYLTDAVPSAEAAWAGARDIVAEMVSEDAVTRQILRELFAKKGVEYTEINVSTDDGLRQYMMNRAGGRRTVPQIFIDGVHVGGCDDLYALDKDGKLDPMLAGGA